MRIGILGGTFNPIHRVHLEIARAAMKQFRLDRVLFVPAAMPPHKQGKCDIAQATHRLRMAELATAGTPEFEVCDIELRRRGPSYSVDTVRELKERFGPETEFFFIMGSDQVLELPTWRDVESLAGLCALVAVRRAGFELGKLEGVRGRLPEGVLAKLRGNVLDFAPREVSSTEVRRRVRAQESLDEIIPEAVERYIRENKLYQ